MPTDPKNDIVEVQDEGLPTQAPPNVGLRVEPEPISDIVQLEDKSLATSQNAYEAVFVEECATKAANWGKRASTYELLYWAVTGIAGLSSVLIATFSKMGMSATCVTVVAFIGCLATPSAAFLHQLASKTRSAHRILSNAVTRLRLGKIDVHELYAESERADHERDGSVQPLKSNSLDINAKPQTSSPPIKSMPAKQVKKPAKR